MLLEDVIALFDVLAKETRLKIAQELQSEQSLVLLIQSYNNKTTELGFLLKTTFTPR